MTSFRPSAAILFCASFLAACADTNAPLPDPVEVLLVVNTRGNSLSIVPVDAPETAVEVPLGGDGSEPVSLAAHGAVAIVPLGPGDAAAVVDLRSGQVMRLIPLPGSGATGAAMVDDSIAYVANPNRNTVSRINYLTGETADVSVGPHPQGVVFTRGRVFVLNGNLDVARQPQGESWLTVIDPAINALAEGIDSIALSGPGNASSAAVGGDGSLYIVLAGGTLEEQGRLSIVDPVERIELASFTGLGREAGQVATDGEVRVFVSSIAEGLLAFDTDSNRVVRGAGEGVPVPNNTGVAVDSRRLVYAIEGGGCGGAGRGFAHVLTGDLEEELGRLPLGRCPAAALTVRIPPEELRIGPLR
ncbi:MAG: hypothetical protein H0T68_04860 [Gemmatimonadales bacterium]|nr:hypothetical protein [Gemmatimonadales bacterium]